MQFFKRVIIIILFIALPFNFVLAASIHYTPSQSTQENVFSAYDGLIELTLPPLEDSHLDVYLYKALANNLPEDLTIVSNAYTYYLMSSKIDGNFQFKVTLKYESDNIYAKHIYQWQEKELSWKALSSDVEINNKSITAQLKGKKGKIIVLESHPIEAKGNIVKTINEDFSVIMPQTIDGDKVTTTLTPFSNLGYAEKKLRVSDIFQFDIKAKEELDFSQPLQLSLKYQSDNNIVKSMYYWDNNKDDWQALPSYMNLEEEIVNAIIHLPFARLALFEEPDQWVGEASWYAYKGGLYAASRDFPKGTKLKVTNLTAASKNFKKSVIVTVNDYGPEEYTKRIIDLDKVAYSKIGYLKGGVMPVTVELIKSDL
ncbi:septal ring lytic transglycosylase RlpA family protein [Patescibacteria group bacterium]|nr:septal ring lytic transglycosylase RlpA family protein [Patescibacteria group bacterium]